MDESECLPCLPACLEGRKEGGDGSDLAWLGFVQACMLRYG
jgi:hypothetical protein